MPADISSVLLQHDILYHVFPCLTLTELCTLENINTEFQCAVRSSELIWRHVATRILSTKLYVPTIVQRLLESKNLGNTRKDLQRMSIKELKLLAVSYGLNPSTCFEKGEIVQLIHERETRKRHCNESLARFAVRIAIIDRTRNCISINEITSIDWHIRVRSDGPLRTLVPTDSWWNYGPSGNTIVNFDRDGMLRFTFQGPSPFESMMPPDPESQRISYNLKEHGSVVYLSSIGVEEKVARHPDNWGFVFMSQGSVWASFPLPERGSDPCLEDEHVNDLVKHSVDRGFEI